MGKTVLKLTDVQKSIGDKKIVHGLTFEVKEGEIYGFLGPNGSGKTTTIRMITGLISMTQGDIQICGHSIAIEREKALMNIGAIVENPELYEYMTGRQNLVHFANMANHKVSKTRIDEIVQLVDLAESIHAPVKTYSLGMKQRLGIAQALLHQPKVLILDEPTNGLDPAGIRKIREYLRELAQKEKIAVIVSSHLLSEIELMCDRVLIINKGTFIKEHNLHEKQAGEHRVQIKTKQTEGVDELIDCRIINDTLFEVTADEVKIAAIIAKLVVHNIAIYEVIPKRKTLEDEFLAITKGATS
ncbi:MULTISPECIES: ABC transporter ATP-binding protein [Bacillus]|uniref:ABC transporter ATP-binding protein n=1 Tax=Bacillus cereus TaxID=1396 RepID=A0A2C1LWK0_BACCE|nr:ABC transporter ATP-binding protein [Bacillus cereus]PGU02823.1 ABC transporter ATP-binding protein [Bacillus cereus]